MRRVDELLVAMRLTILETREIRIAAKYPDRSRSRPESTGRTELAIVSAYDFR